MSGSQSANGFLRETLDQLIERAQADIEVNLPGANARLKQSNLNALAAMSAGMADEQLEGVDYYSEQIHVTTAQRIWLERHGSEWGIIRREATRASGAIAIQCSGDAVVPRFSLFQTQARLQVRTTADADIVGSGTIEVAAEAVLTGPDGNLALATPLTTVSPIAGVIAAQVFNADFAGGNDREEIESYRSRILDRIQQPPQGGAEHDYRAWMLQYPGCTRAWIYPREQGVGTVVCRFTMDNSYPPDGIPPVEEVERMTQWLDLRRPVTAELFVYAPTPRAINVTVRDLRPDTPAVRQAVEDELRDMLYREGFPGAIMYRAWFWEAVQVAAGSRSHTLDAPAADLLMLPGELAVLGTLGFVNSR